MIICGALQRQRHSPPDVVAEVRDSRKTVLKEMWWIEIR